MKPGRFALTMDRLCYQLIENFDSFQNICLIGIQPRGVGLADRIHKRLIDITGYKSLDYGKLDITFYRDDFRQRDKPLKASVTEMEFIVEDRNVILIDDVLYSGRTIRAALDQIADFGRPARIGLAVLIDRGGRELPIQADIVGERVAAGPQDRVDVLLEEVDGRDVVELVRRSPA